MAEQRSLKDKFENDETVKQFRIETGSDCSYYPELTRGLFLCGCGTMNLESSGKCSKCGRTFNDFVSALDEDSLNEKRDARLQREKEEKEAREERERVAAQAAEEARLKEEARKKEKRKKLP